MGTEGYKATTSNEIHLRLSEEVDLRGAISFLESLIILGLFLRKGQNKEVKYLDNPSTGELHILKINLRGFPSLWTFTWA